MMADKDTQIQKNKIYPLYINFNLSFKKRIKRNVLERFFFSNTIERSIGWGVQIFFWFEKKIIINSNTKAHNFYCS